MFGIRALDGDDLFLPYTSLLPLQLPLPEDTERSVVVIVVLLDGARCPAKVSLRLPKTGRVSDLIMVRSKAQKGESR